MEAPKKPLYKSLYFQVICAILLGIALGHFYPQTAQAMKPLDRFIKLIKMIIAPTFFLHLSASLMAPYRRRSSILKR